MSSDRRFGMDFKRWAMFLFILQLHGLLVLSRSFSSLIMAAMYIPNMSRHKDFTTTLGTVKGKILQSVDGTRFEEHTKRQSRQQIEGDLAAKTWIYAAIAACLPDLCTTRNGPLPAASPTSK